MDEQRKKLAWEGEVLSVQPRIRLTRSFDEREHGYLGYVLRLRGVLEGAPREFIVAVGKATHEKYQFRVGDRILGLGEPIRDPRLETADLYEISGLRVTDRDADRVPTGPPFDGIPPALEVYCERGARRLAAKTYAAKCSTCIWACEMAVEMIVNHWKPMGPHKYRRETFCYGPKSCVFYKAGPTRKVPGRKGMSWEEENWVDEDATSHRGADD